MIKDSLNEEKVNPLQKINASNFGFIMGSNYLNKIPHAFSPFESRISSLYKFPDSRDHLSNHLKY
jgi:hypothetical protein